MERIKGIEPSYSAWEADVLPLNYIRINEHLFKTSKRNYIIILRERKGKLLNFILYFFILYRWSINNPVTIDDEQMC